MIDVQYFTGLGTWRKPPGAQRVDVILRGGPGWGIYGLQVDGELATATFDAADMPDEIAITGGGGGYAILVSRELEQREVSVGAVYYGNGQAGFGAGGGAGGAGSVTGSGGNGGHGWAGGGGGGGGAGPHGGGRGGNGGSAWLG